MSAMPNPAWLELSAYMGERFLPEWCNGNDEKVLEEFRRYDDPDEFYATTDIYCYQSVGYFLEGVKRPYYARLLDLIGGKQPSILDYGAGAGDDGLLFLRLGLPVSFADIPSRTFDFMRWRVLRWSRLPDAYADALPVYAIGESGREIPKHDIVWCMDVLEHLPPPEQGALLDRLYGLGNIVFCNLVVDPNADGALHYPVDYAALTEHAYALSGRRCVYRDYHERTAVSGKRGRVRLLLYGEGVEIQAAIA